MTLLRASLALLALFAISLEAAAQLSTSIVTAASSVPTGGTITFTGEVRNTRGLPLSFGYGLSVDRGRIVSFSAPNCQYTAPGDLRCGAQNLPAGTAIPFQFTVQATNDQAAVGETLTATVTGSGVIPDDQPFFSSARAAVPVTASPAVSDLAVSVEGGPFDTRPQPLDAVERVITVTNHGPSVAGPVTVTFSTPGVVRAFRLVSASPPWACTPDPGPSAQFACTIPHLAVGGSSTLRLRLATLTARVYGGSVTAWAANSTDPNNINSSATTNIVAGVATDLTRILIPLLAHETPGARATWTTHVSAMTVGRDATLFFCSTSQCRDDGLRLDAARAVRVWPGTVAGTAPRGALAYIERDAAPQTTFTARLSSSRTSEARGTELPIVRESDFRTDRLVIPDIRLDAEHRFLLRVYDPDGLPHSGVTIRLFQGFLSIVRAEETMPLVTRPEMLFATLPAFPGYTQTSTIFDSYLPASGSVDVGIEIIGLRPGQRIWAFVSATENDGEHVTLITPQ